MKKVLNKRSNDISGGYAKSPTANNLEYGEIAVSYHDGVEKLFIKNDNNQIISFPTDEQVTSSLNEKQDVINDLSTIRSGAALGATAYQKPSGGIPAPDIAEGVIPDVSNMVSGDGVTSIVKLYQSEYDALPVKSDSVFYIVKPDVISAGTIAYWNGSTLKYCKPENWVSSLGTPVAIAVVPNTHTPDGTVRCMAVKGVNADGSSATTNVGIGWGPTGTDTGLPNLNTVPRWNNTIGGTIGSNSYAYLPSNKGFTGSADALDSSLKYYNTSGPFLPNPYLPDGSPNPDYRNIVEATAANACADFDGSGNTAVLVGLGSAYSAANACHLYSAPGIVAGEWYLPAAGELGYMMPRFNQIQSSLSTVGGVQLDTGGAYWSSNEYSSDSARCVGTGYGYVDGSRKTNTIYVRAFCSLPVSLGF